jgi:hypothetical protein
MLSGPYRDEKRRSGANDVTVALILDRYRVFSTLNRRNTPVRLKPIMDFGGVNEGMSRISPNRLIMVRLLVAPPLLTQSPLVYHDDLEGRRRSLKRLQFHLQ